jgi:methyl coenzyme M reductase beta subunit
MLLVNFYTHHGRITLTPDTDYWQDVTTVPTVTIDFGGLAEAIAEVANFYWHSVGEVGGGGSTRRGNQIITNESRTGQTINC